MGASDPPTANNTCPCHHHHQQPVPSPTTIAKLRHGTHLDPSTPFNPHERKKKKKGARQTSNVKRQTAKTSARTCGPTNNASGVSLAQLHEGHTLHRPDVLVLNRSVSESKKKKRRPRVHQHRAQFDGYSPPSTESTPPEYSVHVMPELYRRRTANKRQQRRAGH